MVSAVVIINPSADKTIPLACLRSLLSRNDCTVTELNDSLETIFCQESDVSGVVDNDGEGMFTESLSSKTEITKKAKTPPIIPTAKNGKYFLITLRIYVKGVLISRRVPVKFFGPVPKFRMAIH